jgi:hypothetical protein
MKVRRIMAALAFFTVTAFTDDCTILACALVASRT